MSKKYLHIDWNELRDKNNFKSRNHGTYEISVKEGVSIKLLNLDEKSYVKFFNDDMIILYISGKGECELKLNKPMKFLYKDGYQVMDDWIDLTLSYEITYLDKSYQNDNISSSLEITDNVLTKVNSKETKVIIPEGVLEIGSEVFRDSFVEEVILPSTLKKIGMNSFINCSSLVKIDIPEGVEKIESFAFAFSGLEEISIPKSVAEIGRYAFCGTKFIEKYKKDKFVILGDGLLYLYNGKDSEVIVPEGVKTICELAFFYNSLTDNTIKKITLPNSLISICEGAFARLKVLEEININSKMKIHKKAFFESSFEKKFIEFLNKNGE